MAEAQLLGPAEIRELAAELDVTPTKKLGQNFLHDPNTVRRIVAAAELSEDDHVVEVGPGLGSLTLGLIDTAASVTALEIDPRLAGRLPNTVGELAPDYADRLTVINTDALKASRADFDAAPTALVANLPYNVSVPVLLHLLAELPSIRRVLVMVQKEVADRLAAQPGSKIYGVPSVKAAFYGDVSRAGTIGKHVFWPAPNIESGLVRIDVAADAPRELRDTIFPLVDAAFAQRRKTLRSTLSGIYGSAAAAEDALRAAGIDPGLRGEKLTVADFIRLGEARHDA
ncbi:16S rRNA (adenine(1518)-N(6)/adenine(1519)-N(6))-dimethyltransferase RsmA [Corynebacterium haemomassiliense]|uniref:Ribosomal RNA small subunit methyltransferase A n=1 Tax=Corynebacterium haemomassiliense TaxID=2754726 RepID=A0A7W2E8X6_9CORY|nr:16S rRNA (adenine(1518)-N(6)/adenine(1519)-N(6))-dimethyltransferase RsmA [Corynebacterium haemomassiliense]MBA5243247.1 16S rRNA (adenine(1518)-N(6)/adenine(1519)-N(6))-dimethyltransferase RsmA [Corynebacterium haemomassiliense]